MTRGFQQYPTSATISHVGGEIESVIRTPRWLGLKSADQGCRPAEVADMRRTSLTLAADIFSSHAVSRTPRPLVQCQTNALHLERRGPRSAQSLAR